jgi:Divergent InlB B-repeat domain
MSFSRAAVSGVLVGLLLALVGGTASAGFAREAATVRPTAESAALLTSKSATAAVRCKYQSLYVSGDGPSQPVGLGQVTRMVFTITTSIPNCWGIYSAVVTNDAGPGADCQGLEYLDDSTARMECFAVGAEEPVTASYTFSVHYHACGNGDDPTCFPTVSTSLSVEFVDRPLYSLAGVDSGTGSGTVTSDVYGIDCGPTCQNQFVEGTTVTLTASPNWDSTFDGWGGDCAPAGLSPVCMVSMDGDHAFSAQFKQKPPATLTVSKIGGGSGTVTSTPTGITCPGDCAETFDGGLPVTLTAIPATGSIFYGWESGACAGSSPQCTVTMDSDLSASARFARIPVNTALPKISGQAIDGSKLTASVGTWSYAGSYLVTWLRCGSSNCTSVGTGQSYTLSPADLGFRMQAKVTASNLYASADALSAPTQPVQGAPPLDVDLPVISGTFALGSTLHVTTGTWKGTGPIQFQYQWLRCSSTGSCSGINGASASTYVVQQADMGQKLRARVTAQSNMGIASVVSRTVPATSTPLPPRNVAVGGISGKALVGETLHAGTGSWTGSDAITFTYQWRRCNNASANSCTALAGATGQTYIVTAAELGMRLRVVVTATNGVTWNKMTTYASGVIK